MELLTTSLVRFCSPKLLKINLDWNVVQYLRRDNRLLDSAETKALITRVVEAVSYICPVLCSSEEFCGSDEER